LIDIKGHGDTPHVWENRGGLRNFSDLGSREKHIGPLQKAAGISVLNGERVAFFPEGTTSAQGTVLPFHANLFEAAIEAQVPVQAYAIRYRDDAGNYHPAADFIGEMSFVESVLMILRYPAMHAELIRLPAVSSAGAHRRELAVTMQAKIAQALEVKI
jgi:1-acyl-sn-glycerol-3-phosphate acyltransferase